MAKSEQKATQINLRLSESEAEAIRNRAQASGLSLSAYMRRCALSGAPSLVLDTRELKPFYTELRRCGNNVNQIARALNARGVGGASSAEVSKALTALEGAADAVAKVLSESRAHRGRIGGAFGA